MPQRRMPSGQGPGDRRSRSGRARTQASTGGRATAGRPTVRVPRSGAAGGTGRSDRPGGGPAPVRRAAAPGPARRTEAPRPRRYSGRAVVLGLVLAALLLAYAYPLRVYLAQQAEIASLQAAQQAQRERIVALTEQRAKWNDPEYVKAQARRELQMVLPGQQAWVITNDPAGAARDAAATRPTTQSTGPWYRQLWRSVQSADRPRKP